MKNQESKMSLHKFYKKKEDSEQLHKYTKVDLNSLPIDPFERPSIEFYHVNQRDEIRRAYLQKGPFQPLNHKFPPHDFGEYCTRLNASIDCVGFLLRQGLAFCGHNEKEDSDNKGNFLELLQWVDDQCDVVDRVVQVYSHVILNVIKGDLRNDLFTILVDESHDVSCKEQMELVLQFVNRKGEVEETFIGLINVNDISTFSLKATINDMLSKRHLSPSMIREQGYDGASNISSAFNELKTLIMNETKYAHCAHYFAHQLQLALVFIAKNHMTVNDFFGCGLLLRKKQADKLMAALVGGELESGTSLNQEVAIYTSISDVFEDHGKFDSDRDRDHRAEGIRMLKCLKSLDFVFCLHLMVDILGVTDHLNTILQRKDQDIVDAMNQRKLLGFVLKKQVKVVDLEDEYFNGYIHRRDNENGYIYPKEFPTEYHRRLVEVKLGNYIKDVREDERFNDLKNIGDFAKKSVEVKNHIISPKIYLLVKLTLILPVAIASVERVFSAMKLIKTDIRNKMSDQFLSDSLVSNDTIVKMFQDIRPRRIQLKHLSQLKLDFLPFFR
uniref:DUF4371 domain-containing protein n=1 Tax=Lactuca sativa TaxID=4236 RepID=A0A9R1W0L8_LACSA|nr:hypothetical protein LSAT_V11C400223710 [Lactuca sativa]